MTIAIDMIGTSLEVAQKPIILIFADILTKLIQIRKYSYFLQRNISK